MRWRVPPWESGRFGRSRSPLHGRRRAQCSRGSGSSRRHAGVGWTCSDGPRLPTVTVDDDRGDPGTDEHERAQAGRHGSQRPLERAQQVRPSRPQAAPRGRARASRCRATSGRAHAGWRPRAARSDRPRPAGATGRRGPSGRNSRCHRRRSRRSTTTGAGSPRAPGRTRRSRASRRIRPPWPAVRWPRTGRRRSTHRWRRRPPPRPQRPPPDRQRRVPPTLGRAQVPQPVRGPGARSCRAAARLPGERRASARPWRASARVAGSRPPVGRPPAPVPVLLPRPAPAARRRARRHTRCRRAHWTEAGPRRAGPRHPGPRGR